MTLIRCDWPHKDLFPNGRPNRFVKARKIAAYRVACHYMAKQQNVHRIDWPDGEIAVHLTFHTKTKTLPDDDNLEAAFKAGRDGIAEAMGVDDARFRVTRSYGAPVKGGCVMVQIITEGTVNVPIRGGIS